MSDQSPPESEKVLGRPHRKVRGTESENASRRLHRYAPDTITEHMPGGLEEYRHGLGFRNEDLIGKTILDLGSSINQKFAKDVQDAGINAKVISLSPDYEHNSVSFAVRSHDPNMERPAVAGVAQALPFKDGSFDMILGDYSVTYAAVEPDLVEAWTKEIGRVLKDGGEARVGPTYGGNTYAYGKDYEKLKKYAGEAGLELKINPNYFLFLKSKQE